MFRLRHFLFSKEIATSYNLQPILQYHRREQTQRRAEHPFDLFFSKMSEMDDSHAASHRYYGKRRVKFLTYGVEDGSVGQSGWKVRADDREVGPSESMNRW